MFHRLILGTILLLIPIVISEQELDDELFDDQLQLVEGAAYSELGSGQEEGSGSGLEDCEDSMFGCCPDSSLPAHGP